VEIERRALAVGAQLIALNVNRRNPARQAYERLGFAITGELVTDIGAGFVIDDYRMEKILDEERRSLNQ